MVIFWALGNMMVAALNDLLFKFYARKARSQGLFCAIIGVIWCIFFCLVLKNSVENWKATLIWGSISGFFSIGGNLLMLDSMKKLDVGVCATIYRLNLVPAVLLAAIFLGEKITLIQYIAIVCACLAVLAFRPRRSSSERGMTLSLIVMVIASFMRAGMGLSYRYGFSVAEADVQFVPFINSLFWVLGGLLYGFFREKDELKQLKDSAICKKLLGYGVASGVLVSLITLTMAKALEGGAVSLVLPIMQMSFLVTGLLGVLFMHEKITFLKVTAFILGIATVLLLSFS